jgi:hypothetical protein
MDVKYQEELRRHLDGKDALTRGVSRAYALIFSNYCTRTMQSRVEEHPDFATMIKNYRIELLKAIETSTHDTVRAQYHYVSITDALGRVINVKQYENESLLDYVKRFKQLSDIVKTQFGTKMLDQFVEHQASYQNTTNVDEKDEMKQSAFER